MIKEYVNVKKALPELYKQCYQGNLTEYLKLVSDYILFGLKNYIIQNNIMNNILPIYDAIENEIVYRNMDKKKKLLKLELEVKKIYRESLKAICNNRLTDYFKTLSNEQLDFIEKYLLLDDLIGEKATIYEVLRLEKEYRQSDSEIA